MKRCILASWNGIVPVTKILENSTLTRPQAKILKEYLYQQGFDAGYKYLDDFLESVDFDEEYAEMLKYKEKYPEKWEDLMGDLA